MNKQFLKYKHDSQAKGCQQSSRNIV